MFPVEPMIHPGQPFLIPSGNLLRIFLKTFLEDNTLNLLFSPRCRHRFRLMNLTTEAMTTLRENKYRAALRCRQSRLQLNLFLVRHLRGHLRLNLLFNSNLSLKLYPSPSALSRASPIVSLLRDRLLQTLHRAVAPGARRKVHLDLVPEEVIGKALST